MLWGFAIFEWRQGCYLLKIKINKVRFLVMIPFLVACVYRTPTKQKVHIIDYYERHDKIDPFIMRWYWRARDMSTSAGSETLTLMAGNGFKHCSSTIHLSGCYYGTWTKKENTLVLKANSAQGYLYMPEPFEIQFLINKKQLYYPDRQAKGREWALKRKKLK